MDKKNKIITTQTLEDTLRAKGVIQNGKVIPHKDLVKNKELFDSLTSIEHEFTLYLRYKQDIAETYQETKDWDKVISSGAFFSDTHEGNESFIDYVEELYQVKVKDAKHLQKLIGIKENSLEELEDIILKAKISKYARALSIAIQNGAKYKDLLKIKPKDFGLPLSWRTWREEDQDSSILWAIGLEFGLGETNISLLPALRDIALELDAPYAVVMDAYKLMRK